MQYVLVHGAWQGSSCWKYLAKDLIAKGHQVCSFDLPGHGNNHRPLAEVTYQDYYQCLLEKLTEYQEPIILVAHSMAGMIAAPLLDCFPERILHLFLIAAYVPQGGLSLLDQAISGGPSVIPEVMEDEYHLNLAKAKTALYHDCPPDIADWALSNLQGQPPAPFETKINWNDSGKTLHKRTYLFCEQDRDVHPITQSLVLEKYPCRVIKLNTGHFPFLSNPKALAEILTATIY